MPFVEPVDPVPASVVTAVERLNSMPWMDPPIGGVVSVLVVVSAVVVDSSFSPQEKMKKLKRNIERIISICFTWFPISGL